MQQALDGLSFLHATGGIHRDIKPQHILHNTCGQVKLSGFGITRDLDAECAAWMPTFTYLAPEFCLGEDYSFPVDVWSLGVVAYELLTWRHPFEADNFPLLFDLVTERPVPQLDPEKF